MKKEKEKEKENVKPGRQEETNKNLLRSTICETIEKVQEKRGEEPTDINIKRMPFWLNTICETIEKGARKQRAARTSEIKKDTNNQYVWTCM